MLHKLQSALHFRRDAVRVMDAMADRIVSLQAELAELQAMASEAQAVRESNAVSDAEINRCYL